MLSARRRMAELRRFDEPEPERVGFMGRTVSFFARRSLYEGFRISFSFSQPVGKA